MLEGLTTDEKIAREYLSNIRWGKYPVCPYCSNQRAYFIENGKRFKCASKNCHKKFSVTVKTLMEATNMPLTKWIEGAYIYVSSKGEIDSFEFEKRLGLKKMSSLFMKDKFELSWKYVMRETKNKDELVRDLFEGIFNLYEKYKDIDRKGFLKDIDNISDIKQFRQVQAYTKWWLRYCHWITTDQFGVDDIIAETFIYMADNGIKEYNAESLSFLLRKITQKMWMDWVYKHPNTYEWYRSYWKKKGQEYRTNLRPCYINRLCKNKFPEKVASEIAADKELKEWQKRKIIEFRIKHNLTQDFISHFY